MVGTETEISKALGVYLEAIYLLSKEKNYIRVTDISLYLNISKPSVNRAVNSLKDLGLARHEPYGDIALTEKGKETAAAVCRRHRVIERFLMSVLKIPNSVADKDAVYMEHCLSDATVARMAEYLNSDGSALRASGGM